MSAERTLVLLMRLFSGFMILALFAVFLPTPWLQTAVEYVEPGTKVGILLQYLSRGWSAFYFVLGGLIWLFSTDLPRYAPAARFVFRSYLLLTGGAGLITLFHLLTSEQPTPPVVRFALFNLSCAFALALPITLLYRRLKLPLTPSNKSAPGP